MAASAGLDQVEHSLERVEQRLDQVEDKVDGLRGEMNEQFGELRAEMNTRFAELRGEMNGRFASASGETNTRFAALIGEMNAAVCRAGRATDSRRMDDGNADRARARRTWAAVVHLLNCLTSPAQNAISRLPDGRTAAVALMRRRKVRAPRECGAG